MKKDHFDYLKVIISACLMVGASIGLCFYCAGSFYEPLAAGLGITIGQASAATTFMLVFMAISALAVPFLMRKIRFQVLLLCGTALTAASVLGIAFSFNTVWVYLFSSLMGIGASLIGMVPATTLINNWFEKRRSWTTSVVLAGSALSAALFSPLFSAGIGALGWRMGFVIQAVLVVVMMLPALLFNIQLSPAQAGTVPYGHSREPEPDSRTILDFILWIFALIAVFGAILIALPMHYSTLATSIGSNAILGASMLSAAMIGNLVFKLLAGWISTKIKPVLSTGILDLIALAATIGILVCILTGASAPMITLAFFFGSVYSVGELSLPLLLSGRTARRHFSILYSVLNCISTLMTAFSIMIVGYMYDALQSYVWMYVIAIAAEVVIALLMWMLIHNQKADALVTSDATRSMITRVREFEVHRRQERALKDAKRKEEQERTREAERQKQEETVHNMEKANDIVSEEAIHHQVVVPAPGEMEELEKENEEEHLHAAPDQERDRTSVSVNLGKDGSVEDSAK